MERLRRTMSGFGTGVEEKKFGEGMSVYIQICGFMSHVIARALIYFQALKSDRLTWPFSK